MLKYVNPLQVHLLTQEAPLLDPAISRVQETQPSNLTSQAVMVTLQGLL
jgi:hypothetical protein